VKDPPTDIAAHQDSKSVFGPAGNAIPALQQRGEVFLACHNAIWEQTAKLLEQGINPDSLSHQAIAAELTNHRGRRADARHGRHHSRVVTGAVRTENHTFSRFGR
jgi:uncharacterized membrane-anchored protein